MACVPTLSSWIAHRTVPTLAARAVPLMPLIFCPEGFGLWMESLRQLVMEADAQLSMQMSKESESKFMRRWLREYSAVFTDMWTLWFAAKCLWRLDSIAPLRKLGRSFVCFFFGVENNRRFVGRLCGREGCWIAKWMSMDLNLDFRSSRNLCLLLGL